MLFLQAQSINTMYSNEKNMIALPITKRMQTMMSVPVCLIPWMNINYKENGGMNSFSCKSKVSTSCIPMGEHVDVANHKISRDYYAHPCLSDSIDEL